MSIIKLNNRAVKDATAVGSITGLGNLVFISRSTASSSSSVSITSGLTSTHKEYIFFYNNIHPATDGAFFQFNMSTDGGSNYNVTKTSTAFRNFHTEAGSSPLLDFLGGLALAQSTAYQTLLENQGNGSDESLSGYLHIFDISSTSFVKHYLSQAQGYQLNNASNGQHTGGYANTTSAINAIDFKMSSGNIDSGTINMYGIL